MAEGGIMENIVEVIKAVSTVISSLAVIGGFVVAVFRPIRKKLADWIVGTSGVPTCNTEINNLVGTVNNMQKSLEKHIEKSDIERKETLKAISEVNGKLDSTNQKLEDTIEAQRNDERNIITDIWYRYGTHGEIPRYKYDLFLKTYANYKDHLHGNSFVDDIHTQMSDVKVVD